MAQDLDTSKIKEWRSIVTLLAFVFANILVLFPIRIPIYVPRSVGDVIRGALQTLRIIPPKRLEGDATTTRFIRLNFPLNFITAPLIADLFLLAIGAIGRQEVHDGTLGADNISPIDIMAFFVTLAYIAISIDASGLIRYLAFRVLQRGGRVGPRLYLFLYLFFFILGAFIGNDPIILSGTPFLAYMTRVSSNIAHPRAWIYAQFAIANIASAILVSSNPTNLVLAGAFEVKFIVYTVNMIVPVVVTAIILFPGLLYGIFRDEGLIPTSIKLHDLSEEAKAKKPTNPNIQHVITMQFPGRAPEDGNATEGEKAILPLEEIMNPYLDKWSAAFGTLIMAATLITLLVLNATSDQGHEHPVFWVTVPAAFVMFCWDLTRDWIHRQETREVIQQARQEFSSPPAALTGPSPTETEAKAEKPSSNMRLPVRSSETVKNADLTSFLRMLSRHLMELFPTVTTILSHMPFPLVPFAFAMFVLVQALVTKGWIPVFAHGWDIWVEKTGTIGAIGGMAFLSVVLCNFAGTNIGTTILLSRVIQAWQEIHRVAGTSISDRTFWATVYSMALGVNFGAFSTAFSASLAGLLWRDILSRKHIHVRSLDFARINLPIITICMIVGCVVLIGEVYIVRGEDAHQIN